jgi:hypothetical protein
MSVDAQKLQDAPVYLHFIWSAPITIIVCLVMLWEQLGPAVLAGLGVLILMIPVNAVIAGKIKKYQVSFLVIRDFLEKDHCVLLHTVLMVQKSLPNLSFTSMQSFSTLRCARCGTMSTQTVTSLSIRSLHIPFVHASEEFGLNNFAVSLLSYIVFNENGVHCFQTSQMKHKDTRLKVMNEILNGIKVLKLYAWEPSFEEKVYGIRATEIEELKKAAYLNALTSVTWFVAPTLVRYIA